jgi:pimeloyl-ACP methyl ester carboxylesterase
VLEHPPAPAPSRAPMRAHLIVGGRSGVVDQADREHAARCPETTTLDVIPDADHWVHVDAPDALRALVLRYLGGGPGGGAGGGG